MAARPEITLDTILEDNSPDKGWSVAGAVIVELVYERGGMEAVRGLFGVGRSNGRLRLALSEALGMPWEGVLTAWRERVLRAGSPEP